MLKKLLEEGEKFKKRDSLQYIRETRYGTWRRAYLHFLEDTYGEEIAKILVNVDSDGSYIFDYERALAILEELKNYEQETGATAHPLHVEQAMELREKVFYAKKY